MLDKKLAIVTGASRGLGLAVARELADAGCRVLMVGRNAAAIDAAASGLVAAGRDVLAHVADVADGSAVAALAARVRREFGRLDILVNNAGVFPEPNDFSNPQGASVAEVDPDLVATAFTTNALAPLRLIQALLPLLRVSPAARIVNVSSGMGQLAHMDGLWPGYRMSKAALNALTVLTAAELKGSAIKVNSVCPGWCRTDMGGECATRSPEQGAASIVWAALLADDGPSGGFFRDGEKLEW